MIGSSASTRNAPCPRRLPRSAISAISVPRKVVPAAVSSASTSVFHATPQRTPPARQPRPQMRSVNTRAAKAAIDHCPSSLKKAPDSARLTG
ncbi:hypothetical protein FQZ97_584630 [compost metagenome]